MSWRDEAACRDVDRAIFFPDEANMTAPAKQVCASCTVRAECLDFALENDCRGVWGGLTTRERARLTGRYVEGRSASKFECAVCGWVCMGWRGQRVCNGCRGRVSESRAS